MNLRLGRRRYARSGGMSLGLRLRLFSSLLWGASNRGKGAIGNFQGWTLHSRRWDECAGKRPAHFFADRTDCCMATGVAVYQYDYNPRGEAGELALNAKGHLVAQFAIAGDEQMFSRFWNPSFPRTTVDRPAHAAAIELCAYGRALLP